MPRGYSNYEQKRQEAADGGGGSGIYHIRCLEDGESCKIRYLTDHEDLYWDWFHRKTNDTGGFAGMKLCPRSTGNACVDCKLAKDESLSDKERAGHRAQMQVLAWAYEYEHYYTEPKEDRKKVTLGRSLVRYMKTVNEARLWRYAGAHMKALEPTIQLRNTLLDRDYLWIRSGKKGDTKPQYTLESMSDESELPAELKKLVLSLPDLEEVALERVTSLSGEKTASGETYRTVRVVEEDPTVPPFGVESPNVEAAANVVFGEEPEEEPF